jgi:serine/threonine protein phosphatase PrpC
MNEYKIEAGTAQHIGNRAQQNDRVALFAGTRSPGFVLAVLADGMCGGPAASEQALHTAKHIFDDYKADSKPSTERLLGLLEEIVHETHLIMKMNAVAAGEEHNASFCSLILTPYHQAVWGYVGDSRIYRFQNGQCLERSSDAAYVAHLVAQGMSPEAAKNHRHSKSLTNLVGNPMKEPFMESGAYEGLNAGDSFLLCSDGLWPYFTDAELGAVLARNTPRQASEMLINKAKERSKEKGDNCTMAIVKLAKLPKEPKPDYKVSKLKRAV